MNKKGVRAWLKEHDDIKKKTEELRKELADKDLVSLLALVKATEPIRDAIQTLLIAQILRERGLLDQTKKGQL
jgi:hypothetical protein